MLTMRHDWAAAEVASFYQLPFIELVYQAQTIHRQYFVANQVQKCTLLSIKTGACPEDCAYCPQSGHYKTTVDKARLLPLEEVISQAKAAKAQGATRFCMGAAWRSPPKKDLPKVVAMIKAVKAIGMETCVTLGLLDTEQAAELKQAGLDYYNHNLDSSPEFYRRIISTRTYEDRLTTLGNVRQQGINVCCGGIIGMGESREDRIGLLIQLANLPEHPQSVPINQLIPIAGTPMADLPPLDPFEFIRTIAVARIMLPHAMLRLSAGRESMSDLMQTLCFFAGANSIFCGDKLLTADNPSLDEDTRLLQKLGLETMPAEVLHA